MSGETIITVVGNLTADPELRFTPSGKCVADFTVASTPRSYDRASNEWKDGESLFMRCSLWGEAAENVSESLRKGMRVIVQGRLTQRSFETKSGERRSVVELQVEEVGPSLRRAKAQVVRTHAANQGTYVNAYSGQSTEQVYRPQHQESPQQAQASRSAQSGGQPGDPWASAPHAQPGNTPMPPGQSTPFENAYDAPF